MRSFKTLQYTAVALASLGILCPQISYGAKGDARPAASNRAPVRDIALAPNGQLRGHVIDAQGNGLAGQSVWLLNAERVLGETKTDAQGQFQFANVNGGMYEVRTREGQSFYRAWTPNTAPPAATKNALVVESKVARGQMGGGPIMRTLGNPWVLGGIVAAAIAIPLALDDDDNNQSVNVADPPPAS